MGRLKVESPSATEIINLVELFLGGPVLNGPVYEFSSHSWNFADVMASDLDTSGFCRIVDELVRARDFTSLHREISARDPGTRKEDLWIAALDVLYSGFPDEVLKELCAVLRRQHSG